MVSDKKLLKVPDNTQRQNQNANPPRQYAQAKKSLRKSTAEAGKFDTVYSFELL